MSFVVRKRALSAAALVGIVAGTLGAASLVSRLFFERPTREPPPRRPEPAETEAAARAALFRVAALEGPVEAHHNGQWYVVQAGDYLSREDVIRTQKGARALLRRGTTEIEVRENVDIRLDSLASQTASFGVLRGGNVMANVSAGNETVEIKAQQARAVNRGAARWVVSLGPEGRVSVAASEGEVRFAARGKEVAVRAGQESTASPGQAPGDPAAIPEDLLLSVIWPEIDRARDNAEVTGKVSPSSTVKVNGVEASVAPDGSFAAAVPLRVGPNRVSIEAQDIRGRNKAVERVLKRPGRAPSLEAADEDIWKK